MPTGRAATALGSRTKSWVIFGVCTGTLRDQTVPERVQPALKSSAPLNPESSPHKEQSSRNFSPSFIWFSSNAVNTTLQVTMQREVFVAGNLDYVDYLTFTDKLGILTANATTARSSANSRSKRGTSPT